MKKFLAILLASIMVFALATPAMATMTLDSVSVSLDSPEEGYSLSGKSLIYYAQGLSGDFGYLNSVTINKSLTKWQVKSGDNWVDYNEAAFEGGKTYRAKIVIDAENGYEFSTLTEFKIGSTVISNKTVTSDTITAYSDGYYVTKSFNEINAIIKPVVGEKCADFEVEIEGDAKDGIRPGVLVVAKVPTGQEGDDDAWSSVGENEVFQDGYTYLIQPCYFYAVEGYEISDDAVLTINGETADYEDCRVSLGCISASDVIVTPEAAPKNIDPAPTPSQKDAADTTTTTTTTTAESTAVETGDSSNMMIYAIALIALIAGAGVTIFSTKKSK